MPTNPGGIPPIISDWLRAFVGTSMRHMPASKNAKLAKAAEKTNLCVLGGLCVLLLTAGLVAQNASPAKRASQRPSAQPTAPAQRTPPLAVAHAADASAAEAQAALVKQYCAGCHSEKGKAGGLSLASFDATQAAQHADVSEKIIRKLRAGMMPPPGARRPAEDVLKTLAVA